MRSLRLWPLRLRLLLSSSAVPHPRSASLWTLSYLALGCLAGALVLLREQVPRESIAHYQVLFGQRYALGHNMLLMGVLCAGTAASLALSVAAGSKGAWRAPAGAPPAPWLLLPLALAGFAYFYGGRGVASPYYAGLWDALHYAVGAKYHPELGYDGLYDCIVQADAELGAVIAADQRVRDLYSYDAVPAFGAQGARARRDCHRLFTPSRWHDFKQDLKPLLLYARGLLPKALLDHGYNGTPLRSALSWGLPWPALSFQNLVRLSLLDIGLLSLMLTLVSRAFGSRLGLVFAFFLFLNFSDRFIHIGGSTLRYLWLFFLVLGLVALKGGRSAWAGASLTLSALFNVFPVVFLAGPFLRALADRLRRRKPDPHSLRFAAGSAVAATGGVGLSLLQPHGVERHLEFARKIWLHTGVDNYTRLGLRYVFSPVTATPTEPVGPSLLPDSAAHQPLFLLVAALLLVFAVWVALRCDDLEASVLLGMVLLFVCFGLVQYYYASACVLVLLFHRDRRPGNPLLALLLGLHAGIYGLWAFGMSPPACDHVATSVAYAIFLPVALTYFARAHQGSRPAAEGAR